MAGCDFGYSMSVELIVGSRDPFDPESTLRPDDLARAVQRALEGLRIRVPGERRPHRILEASVCRVAPSFSSLLRAHGHPTPWVGPSGRHTSVSTRAGRNARPKTPRPRRKD